MPVTEMKDHVYKILELVGSSETSIEDAIQNAITRASKTIREMKWFEVVQTRGHIEKDSVRHYQVTLRVGFTRRNSSSGEAEVGRRSLHRAEEECAGFAPTRATVARIALFSACHYPPARHMLAASNRIIPC